VLLILTLTITVLCLITAWGFYRNNWWLKNVYRFASASLAVYALFHFVSALTITAASFAWVVGIVYLMMAAITFAIGWWAV
jgi:ABC-type multidrug transport system permease subunit